MPVMRQAVEQAIGLAQHEGVSLLVTDANLEVNVVGDRDQLLQVLGNLISNAIKFSPREDEVLLSAVPHGPSVRISVTDHGAGIPDAFKPHIFEKFSQADASPARRHEGTGLGLHISKLIVERHGGEIGFETAEAGGSTFYFDLPAPISSAEPGQLAAE